MLKNALSFHLGPTFGHLQCSHYSTPPPSQIREIKDHGEEDICQLSALVSQFINFNNVHVRVNCA